MVLIVVPAISNALPLHGAGHTTLQVVAVVVGTVGMVVVFGGLLQRAFLHHRDHDDWPVDTALLAVPHARVVWLSLALLTVILLAGAVWCLALVHLVDALMLALPDLVLAGATWRARVMRTADPSGEPETDVVEA